MIKSISNPICHMVLFSLNKKKYFESSRFRFSEWYSLLFGLLVIPPLILTAISITTSNPEHNKGGYKQSCWFFHDFIFFKFQHNQIFYFSIRLSFMNTCSCMDSPEKSTLCRRKRKIYVIQEVRTKENFLATLEVLRKKYALFL